jgi:hypothetical protein
MATLYIEEYDNMPRDANGQVLLNLGGTGNAAPSSAGVTDKNTLISRGWTVTTN